MVYLDRPHSAQGRQHNAHDERVRASGFPVAMAHVQDGSESLCGVRLSWAGLREGCVTVAQAMLDVEAIGT